mgnify:CR=1 FL=1
MRYSPLILIGIIFLLLPADAWAVLTEKGILDSVLENYQSATKQWSRTIQNHATTLFLYLVGISMVWNFIPLIFRRSSIAEFFGEMFRFLTFTGFYLWLLRNGPSIAIAIINSMQKIGADTGETQSIYPSDIIDIGFKVFHQAVDSISAFLLITGLILFIVAVVSMNMLLLLCPAWILAYAGIFFLGFGGSRWTSDMAINYFKTVLGVGVQLMTMTLIVGVGTGFINEYHAKMSTAINMEEIGILFVSALTLFMLTDKLPAMVAGIINGASVGGMGVGSFGAGAAIGAAAAGMGFVASSMAGSAKTMAKAATGMARLMKAAKEAKSGLAEKQAEAIGKKHGGRMNPASAAAIMNAKPPSALAVAKEMAGTAAKTAWNNAVKNSAGGKLAENLKKKE